MTLHFPQDGDQNVKLPVIAKVLEIGARYDLHLGRRIIVDSAPYESTRQDQDATYSTHYDIKGYKEHRVICADTGVPLAFDVTPITVYDGHRIEGLLDHLQKAGCGSYKMWADGHYITHDLLPKYLFDYNLDVEFKPLKTWKEQRVDQAEINRAYQKCWQAPGFKLVDEDDCDQLFMLEFIWRNSTTKVHKDLVPSRLVQKSQQLFYETPKQALARCGIRSRVEGNIGVDKKFTHLKITEFRGLCSWTALIGVKNLLSLVFAVYWMGLGRRRNLASSTGVVL